MRNILFKILQLFYNDLVISDEPPSYNEAISSQAQGLNSNPTIISYSNPVGPYPTIPIIINKQMYLYNARILAIIIKITQK